MFDVRCKPSVDWGAGSPQIVRRVAGPAVR